MSIAALPSPEVLASALDAVSALLGWQHAMAGWSAQWAENRCPHCGTWYGEVLVYGASALVRCKCIRSNCPGRKETDGRPVIYTFRPSALAFR